MQKAGEFILSGLCFSLKVNKSSLTLNIPLADLARMFAPDHLDNLVQFLQKA